MNLKPIKANMNEVQVGDYLVLFSYKTPVAFHQAGIGFAKTSKYWSRTTSRHINQWLEMKGYSAQRGDGLRDVDQYYLDSLLAEVK